MALLSPGVEVKEIDLSLTVSSASSSFGAFCGIFPKGPCDGAVFINDIPTLESVFGKPTNSNYNDFFQAYCFLRRAGSLYVVRAIDKLGKSTRKDSGLTINAVLGEKATEIALTDTTGLYVGQQIMFGEKTDANVYTIASIQANTKITFTPEIQTGDGTGNSSKIYICHPSMNAIGEVLKTGLSNTITDAKLKETLKIIPNNDVYETLEPSIKFSDTETKLKFIAKSVGSWGNNIKVAVATKADFGAKKNIISGIPLDDNFEYIPDTDQVAVVVLENNEIKETYMVSIKEGAKDYNNKSNYIEDVINRQSSYVYCKNNTTITDLPKSALDSEIITLKFGEDGAPTKADIISGYTDNFSSKEEIDIDIVIANEMANKECADFCVTRGDVIGYGGVPFSEVVGLKAEDCVKNLLEYRSTGEMNIDNKYFSFIGNYGYIYDKYNDKYRWINLAGATAGLRAYTNQARQPWFAAAGLNQGQYLDIIKLAFNPNNGQRDLLYKSAINPVVSFPSLGICLWGQKTCTQKPSAFDRVNVRMLFNYLERNIANSARYVVFEQNDTHTQNMFVSMCSPLLTQVQAGRGIDAFKIVCDDSNNTPLVKSNNQFIASFMIKPTYAIEFITLNFVAVGATISFEEAIGSI
ncbi:hypothetical protein [Campylobacter phage CJLB-7]|nr:hypothetical protein [Campylobacter phage CJLB-7]